MIFFLFPYHNSRITIAYEYLCSLLMEIIIRVELRGRTEIGFVSVVPWLLQQAAMSLQCHPHHGNLDDSSWWGQHSQRSFSRFWQRKLGSSTFSVKSKEPIFTKWCR
uniref:Uncharacterized protein n=1 Tax=Rhizophora mucronata TaxID=61149 RepID=A0A2P2M220_RHIMU